MAADGRVLDGLDVVLVVGPMRTGTTLVARMLGSHPDAHYLGFELSEEWAAWTGLPWGAPGAGDRTCPALSREDATPARVDAVRHGLAGRLRDEVGTELPRAVVLKNPHLWHRLDFVRAVLPGVRVVRTRRDHVQTVASLRRLWQRSVDQHGHVHHLPPGPDRCWDYIPVDDCEAGASARTFPGGDVAVLAEFVARVEARLDHDLAGERTPTATVEHRELVADVDGVVEHLRSSLGWGPGSMTTPEPIDPSRTSDHRDLLSDDERRAVLAVVGGRERPQR